MGTTTTFELENGNRILLLGASSFVGKHLYKKINAGSAVGTYCKNPWRDFRHFDSVTMELNHLINSDDHFSHAVILLGDTQPDRCFTDRELSEELNVNSIIRIIDTLLEMNIKPVFISSQFVFDGEKGGYIEDDIVNPILVYGEQKVSVEKYLASQNKDYLILRLPHVYGKSQGDGTLLTNWIEKILSGTTEIKCAEDQRFSPIYIGDAVRSILATIDHDCVGTYHIAGPDSYARIELLMILLSKLEAEIDLNIDVIPCSINAFDLPELRPIDVSMIADKLINDTGTIPRAVSDICDEVLQRYFTR